MPQITVLFYKDALKGNEPCKDWLLSLPLKARAAGVARLKLLHEKGHELRRPHADLLRDGIFELRWKSENINYRILYFFDGQEAVLLSPGFTKQTAKVPDKEIDLAIARKKAYEEMRGKGV